MLLPKLPPFFLVNDFFRFLNFSEGFHEELVTPFEVAFDSF